ncbi:hypothetical protein EI533_25340 [Pseudomonas donghuensis]|nr:hypothetical protein [Pseudomonas donghuensis]
MNTRNPLISVLIYPLAPIAVIYLTHVLCRELWFASFYVPGEDGGEVEPAMAMIGIPFLLIIGALLLGGLTVLKRWGAPRWLTALVRVPLVGMALLLSLIATVFFMGQPLAVFSHWQVASAWLAWLGSAGVFMVQQWDRLRS